MPDSDNYRRIYAQWDEYVRRKHPRKFPDDFDWASISPYDEDALEIRNERIEQWRAEGQSYRQIARRIGRSANQVMIILRKRERRRQRERARIEREMNERIERIRRFEEFTRLPGLRVIESGDE